MLLGCRPHEPIFLERQRERLLAEDVLPRLEGLDRDLHVPVVRRDDAHDIDVRPVEHAAVVAVGVRLALADLLVVLRALGMPRIDVADGHDVAKLGMAVGVAGAHAAHTDAADERSVGGRLVGERTPRRGEERDRTGRGDRRRRVKKRPPRMPS